MDMKNKNTASPIFAGFVVVSIGCGFVWGWEGLGWALVSIGAFYSIIGILGAIVNAILENMEEK